MRDLELLGTFLEVYRGGSLTAAAAASGLSQPAVSERVARLEDAIGEPLFIRTRRGVVATDRAVALAVEIGDPVDRLRAALVEPGESPVHGRVRVGAASDVAAARLIPGLAGLAGSELRIDLTLGLATDLLDALAAGRLDVVVSAIRPRLAGVGYRPLVDEEFVLVAAPSWVRAADPGTVLRHIPLVAYDEELSILRRYWRSQFGARPSNPVALTVPDLRAVLAAVIAGVGASALPRYLADPALAQGLVVQLHVPQEPPINTLYLATARRRPADPAVDAVLARLVERAQVWDTL